MDWQPRPRPDGRALTGRYVRLRAADWDADGPSLFKVLCGPQTDHLWAWTMFGPYGTVAEFIEDMKALSRRLQSVDYLLTPVGASAPLGMFRLMEIRPDHGVAEIGAVVFGPGLGRTPAATEAVYLALRHLFDDLGYRRAEWRCNSLNKASRRAGERFGFTYEGTFRQDRVMVKRGVAENRDTDWLSLLDREWAPVRAAFEAWLSPGNFDAEGAQIARLEDYRARLHGPG